MPLPIPPHYRPERVGEVWRVSYEEVATAARKWAGEHGVQPASRDRRRLCLVLIDVQNTFCTPGFELYVGGHDGQAAVEDSRHTCSFLYRNLDHISRIVVTMDTHRAFQIFHSPLLVDANGRPPAPYTVVTAEDVAVGRWRFQPDAAASLGLTPEAGQAYLRRYTAALAERGKYALTIWPFHAMLGGIGHSLVSAIEEAVFFHSMARVTQAHFVIKGESPLTEHYSALGPEVRLDTAAEPPDTARQALLGALLEHDAIVVAGQAKSHCVAWTIEDLLTEIQARDPALAGRVYLLDDCSSPVVVPGVADYSAAAEAAFARFAAAGMHRVRSTEPLETWPGMADMLEA